LVTGYMLAVINRTCVLKLQHNVSERCQPCPAVVLAVYVRARVVPPWVLPALCLSKRVHSIFVLRLFNDCFAMLFAYVAILLFQSRRWVLGAVAFSLGVSVKMNVLLMLPPLLVGLHSLPGVSDWPHLPADTHANTGANTGANVRANTGANVRANGNAGAKLHAPYWVSSIEPCFETAK
jgi:hypothetical protein